MRLDIEGKHMTLAPYLMGWIAEQLDDLNTSYDDICEARVTFVQQGRHEAVCIELLLAGKSFQVTQRGATPEAAVEAAFRVVQRQLSDVRTAQRARTSIDVVHASPMASGPIVAGEAACPVSQAWA